MDYYLKYHVTWARRVGKPDIIQFYIAIWVPAIEDMISSTECECVNKNENTGWCILSLKCFLTILMYHLVGMLLAGVRPNYRISNLRKCR